MLHDSFLSVGFHLWPLGHQIFRGVTIAIYGPAMTEDRKLRCGASASGVAVGRTTELRRFPKSVVPDQKWFLNNNNWVIGKKTWFNLKT